VESRARRHLQSRLHASYGPRSKVTHIARGNLVCRFAPTPNTPCVLPSANFSESYATWMPTGPKSALPPSTHPKFVSSFRTPAGTFQYLWYRTLGEKYGSRRIRETESGVLRPTAASALVASSSVCVPDVSCAWYAPPSCRLTATGTTWPPIRRAASAAPHDVTRVLKVSGFHDDPPAVTIAVPVLRDTRPP